MIKRTRGPRRLGTVTRIALAVIVGVSAWAWARPASAQGWLKDRRYQEGAGIRAGNLELHPGIGGEVGYDSNWFLRTSKEGPQFINGAPNARRIEGGVLRLTPSFSISTLGAQRLEQPGADSPSRLVTFRAGIAATYREFIGPQELRDQRNIGGNANARVDFAEGRPFGAGVFAGYTRTIRPATVADPNLSFNRSDVNAGGELIALPGGGTLDMRLGYQYFGGFYEQANATPYTNHQHEISARNRWRFRPRTALFHTTSLRFVHYPDADRAVLRVDDSTPIRTTLGITGLITNRLGALASAGWGSSFYQNPAAPHIRQYDSVTAQAELTYYLSAPDSGNGGEPGQVSVLLSSVSLGYMRDFQTSLLGNFYELNKGYARAQWAAGGRAIVSLDGYVQAMTYPDIFLNAGGPVPVQALGGFTNYGAGGVLFGEYRLADSFGINTTIDYQQVMSDTQIPYGGGLVFDMAYNRLQAFLGARWFL